MSTRMEMHELIEFNNAMTQGINSRSKKLSQVNKDLERFTGKKSGLDGQAAQAISAYISEVHLGGILAMVSEIFNRFNQLNTMYLGQYPSVDQGSEDFFLLTQDYEEITAHAKKMRAKLSEDEDKLIAITNEVDDLVSSFSTNDAMTEFDKIDERFAGINKRINRQSKEWSAYERASASKYAELDAAISVAKRLIEEYANKSVGQLAGYEEGLFARNLKEKDMQIFDRLAKHSSQDEKLVKTAEKRINKLQKKYQQIEKARLEARRRELNKREGKNSLIIDGLFALAGVAVAACTGGAAIPLVMMVDLAFTGMNLYEDYDKARTGKYEGSNFGKYLLQKGLHLDKKTADGIYDLANIASGIVGSGSAYKSLAKDGYFISRGVTAKPLLSSLKSVKTEVISVKKVTNLAHNFKGRYVLNIGKSVLKKTGAAVIKDAKDIGANLVLGKKNKFLKEGVFLHVNRSVSGVGKNIAKTYGIEAGKQWEKTMIKNYVVSPVVDSATNRLDNVIHQDKNSVQHKFIKKYLTKKTTGYLQGRVNLYQNATVDSITGGKKFNSIIENARKREAFSDGSLASKIDAYLDQKAEIRRTFK